MKQIQKFCLVLPCLLTTLALAETSPGSSTTQVIASAQPTESGLSAVSQVSVPSSTSEFKSLKERLALSYYGVYSGPSLGRQNDFTPNVDGTDGDLQNVDGAISAGYRITKKVQAGVALPIYYVPNRDNDATLNNIYLRLSNSEMLKSGQFKMGLSSRFYLPTNPESRETGFVTGVRVEQNMTYDLKKTPLTFGLYTYERMNFFNSIAKSGSILSLYAAPYLNYQFSQKVAATLWIDLIQLKQVQGRSISQWENPSVGVQPGINWDVNDSVSLNPYVNVYPGNLTADSSSLGLIISAKFL